MTQRTINQNSAYWLYCDLLAVKLNDSGWTLERAILENMLKIEARWTKDNVADMIGRTCMLALWPNGPKGEGWKNPERPSSTELETYQVTELYEVMNNATGIKFGVSLPFPSEESLYYEATGNAK